MAAARVGGWAEAPEGRQWGQGGAVAGWLCGRAEGAEGTVLRW